MNMLEAIRALVATKCKGETEVSVGVSSGKILPISDISHTGEWTGGGKESITIHLDDDDGVQQLRDAAEELLGMIDDAFDNDLILGNRHIKDKANELRELLK